MYTVDKNVPIPPQTKGTRKYPFLEMAIGDSFVVPAKNKINLVNALSMHRKTSALRFTMRTLGDEVRVWRIS